MENIGKMLKTKTFLGLALVITGSFMISSFLLTPEETFAGPVTCSCEGPFHSTGTYWGTGSTCNEAQGNLYTQAYLDYQNSAPSTCGSDGDCGQELIIIDPCFCSEWNQNNECIEWMMDGFMRYQCKACDPPEI